MAKTQGNCSTYGSNATVYCDVCSKKNLNKMDVHYYHCSQCRFDLCLKCSSREESAPTSVPAVPAATTIKRRPTIRTSIVTTDLKCLKGHGMQRFFKTKPAAYNRGGARCDGCKKTGLESQDEAYHHCDKCQYDLCAACSTKKMFAPADDTPKVKIGGNKSMICSDGSLIYPNT
jgi:hypothetical protein